MKKILYILCLTVSVLACTRPELEAPPKILQEPDSTMRVLVSFNVTLPGLIPQTKALGDTPAGDLDNMYIAVFGRSGYLKEYVEATITPATTNGKVGETTNRYSITAFLSPSENSERHIHFIGNAPSSLNYGQETELIPNLLSPSGKGGYWQYCVVPSIKAKRGVYDEFNNYDPDALVIQDGHYLLHEETCEYFKDIPLIRNFSKIVVEDLPNSHFQTISFAAVNLATQGSIAPYYNGGFISNYQLQGYRDLRETLNYPALLPRDVSFDDTVPSESAFTSSPVGAGVAPANGSVYMYERPIPDDDNKPTTVIIYGHFTDPDLEDGNDSGDYYYKVDLMDNDGYYPIYRNFKYRIQIQEILRPGAATPEDALRSMGSGDISADVATQSLTDISDGTSHILVSYMSRTIIRQYPYTDGNETVQLTLKYKYIPDVNVDSNNDGQADWNNTLAANGGPVTITLQNASEAESIISGYTVAGSDDADGSGFRTITITTNAPSGYLRTQYLRVSGSHTNTETGRTSTLYRNVTFSMISTQTMTVTCTPHRVASDAAGKEIRVDIVIPKDLPPSMFPLVFYIEAEKLSLTPDTSVSGNNLPVQSGPSLFGSGDTAFYFIRTLTETEYLERSAESSNTTVAIPCYFKTNKAQSASNIKVVDEEGFFQPGNTQFKNYGAAKDFTNLDFPNGVAKASGSLTPFSFTMDRTDDLPEKVYLKFNNVSPVQNSGLSMITDSSDPYYGWYWYSPTGTSNQDLRAGDGYNPIVRLATRNATGIAEVWIEAPEYNPAHTKWEVPATGISISPSGTQNLLLRVPNRNTVDLTATVTPAAATDVVTWTSSNPGVATVDANGHVTAVSAGSTTITARANDNVSATVTVNVSTLKFSNLSFYNSANGSQITSVGFGNNKDVYFRFDYENGFSGSSYPVTFTLGNLDTADARLVSNGNGTYTFTPTDNNLTQYVHLKTTTRYSAGTVRIAHDYYDATDTKTINRSLFVPAGTLKALGYYIDQSGVEHADVNPTKLQTNNNNGGTAVTLSASKDGASAGTVYFNTSFLSRNDVEDTNNRFSNPNDNTVVYAKYTVNSKSYYGTVKLGDILTAIENDTFTPINLYRWDTGSYSIDFTSSGNYQVYSYSSNGISVNLNNCESKRDWLVLGYVNYRMDIGKNNNDGTISISVTNNSPAGCIVSSLEFTYAKKNLGLGSTLDTQNVTVNGGSPLSDKTTWTSAITGTVDNGDTWRGEAPVTVVMAKPGNGDPNSLSALVITYGYWDY